MLSTAKELQSTIENFDDENGFFGHTIDDQNSRSGIPSVYAASKRVYRLPRYTLLPAKQTPLIVTAISCLTMFMHPREYRYTPVDIYSA
jgi:hypothetical protein